MTMSQTRDVADHDSAVGKKRLRRHAGAQCGPPPSEFLHMSSPFLKEQQQQQQQHQSSLPVYVPGFDRCSLPSSLPTEDVSNDVLRLSGNKRRPQLTKQLLPGSRQHLVVPEHRKNNPTFPDPSPLPSSRLDNRFSHLPTAYSCLSSSVAAKPKAVTKQTFPVEHVSCQLEPLHDRFANPSSGASLSTAPHDPSLQSAAGVADGDCRAQRPKRVVSNAEAAFPSVCSSKPTISKGLKRRAPARTVTVAAKSNFPSLPSNSRTRKTRCDTKCVPSKSASTSNATVTLTSSNCVKEDVRLFFPPRSPPPFSSLCRRQVNLPPPAPRRPFLKQRSLKDTTLLQLIKPTITQVPADTVPQVASGTAYALTAAPAAVTSAVLPAVENAAPVATATVSSVGVSAVASVGISTVASNAVLFPVSPNASPPQLQRFSTSVSSTMQSHCCSFPKRNSSSPLSSKASRNLGCQQDSRRTACSIGEECAASAAQHPSQADALEQNTQQPSDSAAKATVGTVVNRNRSVLPCRLRKLTKNERNGAEASTCVNVATATLKDALNENRAPAGVEVQRQTQLTKRGNNVKRTRSVVPSTLRSQADPLACKRDVVGRRRPASFSGSTAPFNEKDLYHATYEASAGATQCYATADRSHYMGLFLCKNIQDANAFVGCPNYFKYFKKCEYGQRVSAASRRAIVQFIVDVGRGVATPISNYSIHMAINLFDRYLSQLGRSKNNELRERAAKDIAIIGAASLYICSKMEDSWCLSLGDICKVFNGGSDSRRLDVLRWELEISREFNFMFYSPTVLDFIYKMVDLASPFLIKDLETSSASSSSICCAVTPENDMKQVYPLPGLTPEAQQHTTTSSLSSGDTPLLLTSQTTGSLVTAQLHPERCPWDARSVPYVAGTGERGLSSPHYFLRRNKDQWEPANSSYALFSEQLAAEALSIGELSLMHHTCIGIPVHLIAAAALLVAITERFHKRRHIDYLPQPVRAFLGKDRRRLARVAALVAAILDERAAALSRPQPARPLPLPLVSQDAAQQREEQLQHSTSDGGSAQRTLTETQRHHDDTDAAVVIQNPHE